MSLAINHNLMAANTARNLNTHYGNLATSTKRLSSGLRINGAADDAAGLAIRELMRADVTALHQGVRNANDAISMIQVTDGALAVIDEKLIRMKELAEQAATGTYDSTQRLMIDSEFQAMASEIERIAEATDFNGIKLIDGEIKYNLPPGIQLNKPINTINSETTENNTKEIVKTLIDNHGGLERGDIRQTTILDTITTDTTTEYFINDNNKLSVKKNEEVIHEQTTQETILTFEELVLGRNYTYNIWVWTNFDGIAVEYLHEDAYDLLLNYSPSQQRAIFDDRSSVKNIGTFWPNHNIFKYTFDLNQDNINDIAFNVCMTVDWGFMHEDMRLYYAEPAVINNNMQKTVISHQRTEKTEELDIDVLNNKVKIHFGPMNDSAEDYYYIEKRDCTLKGLGIDKLSIETQDKAQGALVQIDQAIAVKDQARAYYGAMQNRLENTVANLTIQAENLQASESRISDVDVATEMTNFVRNQILTQSAVAMLSQANTLPQMAMQLIRG